MRTLWIVLGGLAAAATAAGIVYAVRNRRRAVEAPEDLEPFDVVEAELIEVEAFPVIGIAVDPGPIMQTDSAAEGAQIPNEPGSRRY